MATPPVGTSGPTNQNDSLVSGRPPGPWNARGPGGPSGPSGDGATPKPADLQKLPPDVTAALSRLQDALGTHLPARLSQVQASARRIRAIAGK